MQYKYIVIAIMAVSGCVKTAPENTKRDSTIVQGKNVPVKAFDDRSTDIAIVNWIQGSGNKMILIEKAINSGWDSGEWKKYPSDTIEFNSASEPQTTSDAWGHGAGGSVKYMVEGDGTILSFEWSNPYSGDNTYYAGTTNNDYYFTTEGTGKGNNAWYTWNIRKKPPMNQYSVVIMADPQPWRLDNGVDPNSTSNQSAWKAINQATYYALISHNALFHIMNGDSSEFGRTAQYNDYSAIYHSGKFTLEGLGNHDYANNVGDCNVFSETGSISEDGCALLAVKRQYLSTLSANENIALIQGNNFSWDIVYHHDLEDTFGGSLAYSWDVGDIHYVQLQNHPSYAVSLRGTGFANANITKSLDWLANDLNIADSRGKVSILNFHDARPAYDDDDSHFINKNNLSDLARFKSIITSHNVKAVFVGHTHQQAYCRAQDDKVFGNIPLYTAGALFKGDYYLIDVNNKDINVKAYNGKTGVPVLLKDYGKIGSDTSFSADCSNL